jgi:chromosomal replication initiator protein
MIFKKIKDGNSGLLPADDPYRLIKDYTFDNFVMGPGNQFAYSAAKAVADAAGRAYNPLFMYGETGSGSTHLMNAIGHHVRGTTPTMKVSFVSSEQFTNELLEHVANERIEAFRQKFRTMDVLLIDDIQFMSGRKNTVKELVDTFCALYNAKKQIVITCNRHPKDLPDMYELLSIQFVCGLIVDIKPPDFKTRLAILKSKAQLLKIDLDDETAKYIAGIFKTNIREMNGALIRLQALSSLANTKMTKKLLTMNYLLTLGRGGPDKKK